MADLIYVAPEFNTTPFRNLLPSLEKACISCADLLVLDANEVRKRAGLPFRDVCCLRQAVGRHLQESLRPERVEDNNSRSGNSTVLQLLPNSPTSRWRTVSTLDDELDTALGGGFPIGYVSEITGESGVGKTQLLLTLLLSVQLPAPHGLSRAAIYISTEGCLQTGRLLQILHSHQMLISLNASQKPALSHILSIQAPDLEAQDHILQYQLPIIVKTHNVGLIVIDSITANFRAEFERGECNVATTGHFSSSSRQNRRSAQIVKLGGFLRDLARREDLVIVVANQVSDRFNSEFISSLSPLRREGSTPEEVPPRSTAVSAHSFRSALDTMSLDHQQRWFTGWGNYEDTRRFSFNLKTPSLGLIWANQIACRIVILRESGRMSQAQTDNNGNEAQIQLNQRRLFKVVFASWASPISISEFRRCDGIEVMISKRGISSNERLTSDVEVRPSITKGEGSSCAEIG